MGRNGERAVTPTRYPVSRRCVSRKSLFRDYFYNVFLRSFFTETLYLEKNVAKVALSPAVMLSYSIGA